MLCTSGFTVDVMFSHTRVNGPESGDVYVSESSPGGTIRGKVAVYDCRLVLLLLFTSILMKHAYVVARTFASVLNRY